MKQISEEVIGGWPVYALTLKEILENLGFKQVQDKEYIFTGDSKLLDAYPITLQSDVMGYGVHPKYVVEVDSDIYQDESTGLNVFNIFREKVLEKYEI